MKLYFITLFPDELKQFFCKGIIQRGIDSGRIDPHFISLRDFAINRHGQVDDPPFGGKKGMLLRVDVLYNAITSIPNYTDALIYYTCPKGPQLSQAMATQIQKSNQSLIILSGFYEGIDERLFELLPIQRFSLGEVILLSGDAAALSLAEAVCRLIPGVIGDPDCITDDSFVSGILEYPQYAPPRVFQNVGVPDILVSGHHQKIAAWKRKQSLGVTLFNNPTLFAITSPSTEDQALLTEFLKE